MKADEFVLFPFIRQKQPPRRVLRKRCSDNTSWRTSGNNNNNNSNNNDNNNNNNNNIKKKMPASLVKVEDTWQVFFKDITLVL